MCLGAVLVCPCGQPVAGCTRPGAVLGLHAGSCACAHTAWHQLVAPGPDTAARGLSLQVGALGFCRHRVVLSVVNTEWLQLHGVCVSLFLQLPSSICCRG
jgi:hypothetical protein